MAELRHCDLGSALFFAIGNACGLQQNAGDESFAACPAANPAFLFSSPIPSSSTAITNRVVRTCAGRILNRLVEGMRPADVSTFAITIPVLIIAALFASFVPARRASRIDPVSALRQQ